MEFSDDAEETFKTALALLQVRSYQREFIMKVPFNWLVIIDLVVHALDQNYSLDQG